MTYGVAGRGEPVPEARSRTSSRSRWRAGVRTLDTASAYGDIEERLGGLMRDRAFKVTSKIPALPLQRCRRGSVRA